MGKSGGRKRKPSSSTTSNSSSQSNGPLHPPAPATTPSDGGEPIYLRRAQELKEEGNRRFQSRDFVAALDHYDRALRLLPPLHPDRAVFHSNRAACLLQIRPVDHEAVAAECSLALRAQPGYPRALLRRARALEVLGRPDLALRDALALLASDPSHPDALDLARRLRSAVDSSALGPSSSTSSSRPSPAAVGASIAGLGPCLPTRPSLSPSKKASTLPQSPTPLQKSDKNRAPPSQPPALRPVSLQLENNAVVPLKANGDVEVVMQSEPLVVKKSAMLANVGRMRPLKLVYDHDIRLAQMPERCSFRVLREIVGKRFPSSKAVLIKFKDADGDWVTVTSTAELRLAEAFVDREGEGGDKGQPLQMLRLHILEVSPEQEPELDGEEEVEKMVEDESFSKPDETPSAAAMDEPVREPVVENGDIKASFEEETQTENAGKKDCGHPECKEVEIDDWMFEFAQLFRTHVGIDPDAHVDLHELGMELCSDALEETVTSEEAQELFEMAAVKFQEVAALAFFNWGNVHMCAARKRIPLDESSPKDVLAAQLQSAYDWVRERYALAGQKYEESLRIKPDFYEGLLALGQQHFETAKLHWSFAQASKIDLTKWDSKETMVLFDNAEEKMKAATEMWEKVEEQRSNGLKDRGTSKKDELLKRRTKQMVGTVAQELSPEELAEQAALMRSQIHLFWGNMLFERSQVEFKLGMGDWKSKLDAAVERFKLAGASESDITTVIKNHASNGASSNGDDKKVLTENTLASQANAEDEVKHVLES